MKKPKVSLNGAAIKEFFVNHGEKLILAAVVLLLFKFAYGAISAQPIDPTMPDKIKSASQTAQAEVNKTPWSEEAPKHPEWNPVNYSKGTKEAIEPLVQIAPLTHDTELSPAPFKPLIKRADPKLFPPIELVVYGTSALVPYPREVANTPATQPGALPPRRRDAEKEKKKGKAGAEAENRLPPGPGGPGSRRPRGEEDGFGGTAKPAAAVDRSVTGAQLPGARAVGAQLVPKYMTVVTALVPFEEQFNEYKKRFEEALGKDLTGATGNQFMPMYHFFVIQRAEVKDDREQVAEANWKTLDYRSAANDASLWAGVTQQTEPPIDPLYSFKQGTGTPANSYTEYLEWPLPPMVLKNWGFEATHPKVPFLKPMEEEVAPDDTFVDPLAKDPMEGGMPGAPGGNMPRPGGPGFGRGGVGGRGFGGRGGGMGDEFGGRGGGMRGRGGMGGGMGGRMGGGEMAGMSYAPEVPYKLYRYVDMTCEKGKRYRYRVRLVLENPNFEFPPGYLEKPESAKDKLVYSPYSEPSPVAEVPMNAEALAAGATMKSGEIEATVSLLQLVEWKLDPRRRTTGAAATVGDDLGMVGGMNAEPTSGWIEVLKDFAMPLGAVAYFSPVTAEKVLDMAVEMEKKKIENLTMDAHLAMLIDVRGEDPLGTSKTKGAVTEMIFFDKDGRLFSTTSAEGYLKSEDYKDRTWVPDEITGGGFPGGMGDEFGGRGPGRGFGRGGLGE